MTVLSIIAIGWLAFAIWRGYKRGIWRVLAGMLGLLAGYVGLFFWGAPLAKWLSFHVPGLLGWPLAAMVIFTGATIAFTLLLKPLAKRGEGQLAVSMTGAGLNAVIAALMLMGAIWGLSFLLGAKPSPMVNHVAITLGYYQSRALVDTSHRVVAYFFALGLRMVGAPPSGSELVTRISRSPAEGVQQLQKVGQSPETQNLFHSQDLQSALRSGDANAVAAHPDFVAFAEQPGLETLVGQNGEVNKNEMAGQLLNVWQRLESVRESPEVKAAIEDPEVQALIHNGDTARLMANPKLQPVLQAVMEQFSKTPTASATAPDASFETIAPRESESPPSDISQSGAGDLYQWFDDSGQVNYATWDKVPKKFRASAKAINP